MLQKGLSIVLLGGRNREYGASHFSFILLFPSPLFKTEVVEKMQTLLHFSTPRGKEVLKE